MNPSDNIAWALQSTLLWLPLLFGALLAASAILLRLKGKASASIAEAQYALGVSACLLIIVASQAFLAYFDGFGQVATRAWGAAPVAQALNRSGVAALVAAGALFPALALFWASAAWTDRHTGLRTRFAFLLSPIVLLAAFLATADRPLVPGRGLYTDLLGPKDSLVGLAVSNSWVLLSALGAVATVAVLAFLFVISRRPLSWRFKAVSVFFVTGFSIAGSVDSYRQAFYLDDMGDAYLPVALGLSAIAVLLQAYLALVCVLLLWASLLVRQEPANSP